MKGLISLLILVAVASSMTAHAKFCSLGAISEQDMHLSTYRKSQSASSFRINCDQAYSIRFTSMNLRSPQGESAVSNGAYKLSTRMWIQGANKSEWNTMLSPNSTDKDNKYVVGVQLLEAPTINTPAGIYRDVVYISLSF